MCVHMHAFVCMCVRACVSVVVSACAAVDESRSQGVRSEQPPAAVLSAGVL